MTDQLDDRLRAWTHDLDNAIADARIDHEPYVDLGLPRRRSRTGMVAMAAAACLLIGSLAVVAALVSTEPDGDTPVGSDGESPRRPPSTPTTPPERPSGPPESLDPLITDASPSAGSSLVTTEDGDRIGLVLADETTSEPTSMGVCVKYEPADRPSTASACGHRSSVLRNLVAAGIAPGADEAVLFGAVGANGTTIRARYPSGETISFDTMVVPDMGGARVFVLKVPLDTPLDVLEVLSRSGGVLDTVETDFAFRMEVPPESP